MPIKSIQTTSDIVISQGKKISIIVFNKKQLYFIFYGENAPLL